MGRRIGRPKRFSGGVGRPGSGEFSGNPQPAVPSGSTSTAAPSGGVANAVHTLTGATVKTISGATVTHG
jgi:hypothetical protein